MRTVTPEGVDHVMRLFLAHCADDHEAPVESDARLRQENADSMDVVCDEEAIAYQDAGVHDPERDGARDWPDYGQFLRKEDWRIRTRPDAAPPSGAGAMEALDRSAMRAPIEAMLPRTMRAGTVVSVPCTVRNNAEAVLSSSEPYPIFMCYRWYDDRGALVEVGRSLHTPLPAALHPGASADVSMRIAAPQHAGRYRLRVGVLQSRVAWFDDVDPRNGLDVAIDVAERTMAGVPG